MEYNANVLDIYNSEKKHAGIPWEIIIYLHVNVEKPKTN